MREKKQAATEVLGVMVKSIKKSIFAIIIFLVVGTPFFSQTRLQTGGEQSSGSQTTLFTASQQKLRITTENVRLVADKENGGYHLYVKKLPNVNSILLTETTKDPTGKNDSYAYRAKEYNQINGDEIRYLDGKVLVSEGAKYSLVDSTPENTDFFGPAFHIYIPATIVYGYPWSRNGEVTLGKGTFINIRSFEKPYADYSGDYMDSPFMFDLKVTKKKVKKVEKKPEQKPLPPPAPAVEPIPEPEPILETEVFDEVEENPPVEEIAEEIEEETILTDDYNPVASDKFKEISQDIIYSKGPETIIEDIRSILKDLEHPEDLDLVFAIDATGSMKNDIEKLKSDLMNLLVDQFGKDSGMRVGLLFYRDYGDTYKYMNLPVRIFSFTTNLTTFSKNLNSVRIYGTEGGDIPEAVYEAMYAASEFYTWRNTAQKQVILIGDAEPHPTPRGSGKYSKDYVMDLAKSKGIKIRSILLPKD